MNMNRFNFDLLFDGSIEQQSHNVHEFMHGVETAQTERCEAQPCPEHLRGDGGLNYIAQLSEIEDMILSFEHDPRTVSLANELEVQNKKRSEEAREKLGRQIADQLSKVL